MLPTNSRVDHFRIIKHIGSGGMGSVYLAQDERLDTQVVIKIMKPNLAQDVRFHKLFLNEGRAIARLDHPNIIKVKHLGGAEGQNLYLVMDYYSHGNLRNHMLRNQITLGEALELVSQIGKALFYAHEHEMIHRDVKPENVLMEPAPAHGKHTDMRALLADFGLVKLKTDHLQTNAAKIGTFTYMAPEAFTNPSAVDSRSDIYSLGILMYELVLGQRPFDPEDMTDAEKMHNIEPVPDIELLRPGLPQAVQAIIYRCLRKNPADRYATAHDLVVSIDNGLGNMEERQLTANTQMVTVIGQTFVPNDPILSAIMLENTSDSDILAVQLNREIVEQFPVKTGKHVILIGRAGNTNDVVLPADNVSRHHLRIERTVDSRYRIMDLKSANGTYLGSEKIPTDKWVEWEIGTGVRVGDYQLSILPAISKEQTLNKTRIEAPAEPQPTSEEARSDIGVKLSSNKLTLAPGDTADITVEIHNMHHIVSHFTIELEGLDENFYTLPSRQAYLMPDHHAVQNVRFHPPANCKAHAGEYPFTLRIVSTVGENRFVQKTANLSVTENYNFTVQMEHSVLEGWGNVTELKLENTGNSEDTYIIVGKDPARALGFTIDKEPVRLSPCQSVVVPVKVTMHKSGCRKLIGANWHYPFQIEVSSQNAGEEQLKRCDGTLRGSSIIPSWVLPSMAGIAFLAIAGLIVLLLQQGPSIDSAETKTTDAEIAASQTAIALADSERPTEAVTPEEGTGILPTPIIPTNTLALPPTIPPTSTVIVSNTPILSPTIPPTSTVIVSNTPTLSTAVLPQPSLHLSFNGNIADQSANRLSTIATGTLDYVAGIEGQAAWFDGSGEAIEVANVGTLGITDAFTLAFWVNMSDWKNPYEGSAHIESIAHRGNFYGIDVNFDTWALRATLQTENTGDVRIFGSSIQPGEWHHIAFVYQGNVGRAVLFLNGRPIAETSASGQIVVPDNVNFVVGTWFEQNQAFAGYIDELRLYNVALSNSQVQSLARR